MAKTLSGPTAAYMKTLEPGNPLRFRLYWLESNFNDGTLYAPVPTMTQWAGKVIVLENVGVWYNTAAPGASYGIQAFHPCQYASARAQWIAGRTTTRNVDVEGFHGPWGLIPDKYEDRGGSASWLILQLAVANYAAADDIAVTASGCIYGLDVSTEITNYAQPKTPMEVDLARASIFGRRKQPEEL